MAQGTVKWFNNEKGYGFIAVDVVRTFVHFWPSRWMVSLSDGQRVEFEITRPKGPQADGYAWSGDA